MTNIFLNYPEFIDSDTRTAWKSNSAGHYTVSAEFQYHRHRVALPPEQIKNQRVLDLGCLNAATGAWCLAAGAASYTGVELQHEFVSIARTNLHRYFDVNWQILQQSFGDFFKTNCDKYDVVVGYGIMHGELDIHQLLANIAQLDAEIVALDSKKPPLITRRLLELGLAPDVIDQIDRLSLIELFDFGMLSAKAGHEKYQHKSALATSAAVIDIMNHLGYGKYTDHTMTLRQYFPDVYTGRYSINFAKQTSTCQNFETVYNQANK
jgi:SAM-dependent methyltransferase